MIWEVFTKLKSSFLRNIFRKSYLLTQVLKWWKALLGMNFSELLYLSEGRCSHKSLSLLSGKAARLNEKQGRLSKHISAHWRVRSTKNRLTTAIFKWENLSSIKLIWRLPPAVPSSFWAEISETKYITDEYRPNTATRNQESSLYSSAQSWEIFSWVFVLVACLPWSGLSGILNRSAKLWSAFPSKFVEHWGPVRSGKF